MTTYLFLSLAGLFLAVFLDTIILKTNCVFQKATWKTAAVLLLFTLVFDQILTGLPIVIYNSSHILGFRLGFIPIEDLSYPLIASLLVPSLATYFKKNA